MFSINEQFLKELEVESVTTKRMLERVPLEHSQWQPHQKSFPIGTLATHIAEIPGWMHLMISSNELDFATMKYTPPIIESSSDLIKLFDENTTIAKNQLLNADEQKYNDQWVMRNGTQIYFSLPRVEVVRTWIFNHIVHHRAQLGVYLRLLNIPLPSTYGPTADD